MIILKRFPNHNLSKRLYQENIQRWLTAACLCSIIASRQTLLPWASIEESPTKKRRSKKLNLLSLANRLSLCIALTCYPSAFFEKKKNIEIKRKYWRIARFRYREKKENTVSFASFAGKTNRIYTFEEMSGFIPFLRPVFMALYYRRISIISFRMPPQFP